MKSKTLGRAPIFGVENNYRNEGFPMPGSPGHPDGPAWDRNPGLPGRVPRGPQRATEHIALSSWEQQNIGGRSHRATPPSPPPPPTPVPPPPPPPKPKAEAQQEQAPPPPKPVELSEEDRALVRELEELQKKPTSATPAPQPPVSKYATTPPPPAVGTLPIPPPSAATAPKPAATPKPAASNSLTSDVGTLPVPTKQTPAAIAPKTPKARVEAAPPVLTTAPKPAAECQCKSRLKIPWWALVVAAGVGMVVARQMNND